MNLKRKSFEQKREEVKRLTGTMDQSIESYFETPEQMAEHLAFMMQFYQYSLRNTALIQSQFKGAKAVGSYKFWQDKGFQVQKGEKAIRSEEHTSELQSRFDLVCRLLLEKKNYNKLKYL